MVLLLVAAVGLSVLIGAIAGWAADLAGLNGSHAERLGWVAGLSSLCGMIAFGSLTWWWGRSRLLAVRGMVAALERTIGGSGEPEGTRAPGAEDTDDLRWRLDRIGQEVLHQHGLLEQQREEMLGIVNGIGEGLLAIDRSRRVVLANQRLLEWFGVRSPVIGRPFVEVVRNTALIAAFDRALDGAPSTGRGTVAVGGIERQIEIRAFPMESPDIAAVALLIDVTHVHNLERIRQDFIADFSHEVRTPLAAMRSAVETLDEGRLEPDQEEQLRRIITRQVGRLERLVQDLAELKSIEGGELVLHREPTHLRSLLTDLVQDFTESSEAAGIRIVLDGVDVVAEIDPVRVQQVFSNLINNGLKHAAGSEELRITVADGGHEAVVLVSDQGPGIPEEQIERIFHRFYRVDRSRSRETAGAGLGLAITKHLVRRHGGSISARSTAGQGTTFTVTFPKKAPVRDEPGL